MGLLSHFKVERVPVAHRLFPVMRIGVKNPALSPNVRAPLPKIRFNRKFDRRSECNKQLLDTLFTSNEG